MVKQAAVQAEVADHQVAMIHSCHFYLDLTGMVVDQQVK
jgi:hypothetical protein